MCVVKICDTCVANQRESVENSPSHIPKNILHMKEKILHTCVMRRTTIQVITG